MVVDKLLIVGVRIFESTDLQGNTPPLQAIINGHPSIVERLIRAGANIHASNHMGQTPLLLSVNGHFQYLGRHYQKRHH